MRYAVLIGDYVENVIECSEAEIGRYCQALGLTGYVPAPLDDPKARSIEPGGQIPNASAARDTAGDGVALDLAKVGATVRASAVPAAERAAAEQLIEAARDTYAERAAELVKVDESVELVRG